MQERGTYKGQTALITGASAGIGRELAMLFASHGFDLIVTARRQDQLQALADDASRAHGVGVTVIPLDLTAADAPQRLYEDVCGRGLSVDVLVNDAGVALSGGFVDQDPDHVMRMLLLNVVALTLLSRLFIPAMVERRHGRVLNVASVAGFQPIPSLAVYAATKAYILSLTESLSEELRDTGVTATALCPGLTHTDMYDTITEENETLEAFPELMIMDAKEVAREGFDSCMRGTVIDVPGLINQAIVNWSRFQPRWVVRMVGGFLGRRAI